MITLQKWVLCAYCLEKHRAIIDVFVFVEKYA
jgi:hypothetical protein